METETERLRRENKELSEEIVRLKGERDDLSDLFKTSRRYADARYDSLCSLCKGMTITLK